MVASILLIIIFVIAMYDNIHEAVVAVKGGAKGQQLDEPVTKKAVITNVEMCIRDRFSPKKVGKIPFAQNKQTTSAAQSPTDSTETPRCAK